MVRKLPVIQSVSSEDAEAEARPRWQWLLITVVFTFVFWMPLLMIASWVRARWVALIVDARSPETVAESVQNLTSLERGLIEAGNAGLPLGSLALACAASGALLGRFGGRHARWDAAFAAGATALIAWGVTVHEAPFEPLVSAAALLVSAAASVGGGLFGAFWGRRQRPGATKPGALR